MRENTTTLEGIKLVLFDFDGTLYVGGGMARHVIWSDVWHCLWSDAERRVRKSMAGEDYSTGEAWSAEHCRRMSSRTWRNPRRMEEWYRQSYMPAMVEILRKHYKAREGAAEAIAALKTKGIVVGIFSDYMMTEERMEALGLGGLADMTWCAEQMGALKPAVRPFKEILAETGFRAEETLMIGDRADTDGAGAAGAGIRCLLIEGKHSENDMGIEAMPWEEIVELLKN